MKQILLIFCIIIWNSSDIFAYADSISLKAIWVGGEKQEQVPNSIVAYSNQTLMIEFPIIANATYKYIFNDTSYTTTSYFTVLPKVKSNRYSFHGTITTDSSTLQLCSLSIQVKPDMMSAWWFSLLLITYLMLLFAGGMYLVSINTNRSQERLTDLRRDWTNQLHNDIGGDLSGASLRLDILKRKMAALDVKTKEDVNKIYDLLGIFKKSCVLCSTWWTLKKMPFLLS
ncbi:MAG: hypothetical protein HC892_01355 [Saprospiraceae bacterium]|nr:hypothetical protein [Saprospiraceae bacterium]